MCFVAVQEQPVAAAYSSLKISVTGRSDRPKSLSYTKRPDGFLSAKHRSSEVRTRLAGFCGVTQYCTGMTGCLVSVALSIAAVISANHCHPSAKCLGSLPV